MFDAHHYIQDRVDRIYEDTMFQSNPRTWMEHPLMAEILAVDPDVSTPILLDMVWHDPNWILLSALRMLHGDKGPEVPVDLQGRFHPICNLWVGWGVRMGFTGPVADLDTTEEIRR